MKKRKKENRNKATERAIFIRELKPCLRDSRHRPFNIVRIVRSVSGLGLS